jgi:hypothetical protein
MLAFTPCRGEKRTRKKIQYCKGLVKKKITRGKTNYAGSGYDA